METERATVGQETGELYSGSEQGMGRWRSNKGVALFVGKGRQEREGEEESNGVEAWRKQGMSPEDSNVFWRGGSSLN